MLLLYHAVTVLHIVTVCCQKEQADRGGGVSSNNPAINGFDF